MRWVVDSDCDGWLGCGVESGADQCGRPGTYCERLTSCRVSRKKRILLFSDIISKINILHLKMARLYSQKHGKKDDRCHMTCRTPGQAPQLLKADARCEPPSGGLASAGARSASDDGSVDHLEGRPSGKALTVPGYQTAVVSRRVRGRRDGGPVRGGDVAILVRNGLNFTTIRSSPLQPQDTTGCCAIRVILSSARQQSRYLDIFN